MKSELLSVLIFGSSEMLFMCILSKYMQYCKIKLFDYWWVIAVVCMALFFGMLAMERIERLCVGYGELVFVVCGVCRLVPIVFCYHYCVAVCHYLMNLWNVCCLKLVNFVALYGSVVWHLCSVIAYFGVTLGMVLSLIISCRWGVNLFNVFIGALLAVRLLKRHGLD